MAFNWLAHLHPVNICCPFFLSFQSNMVLALFAIDKESFLLYNKNLHQMHIGYNKMIYTLCKCLFVSFNILGKYIDTTGKV